MTDGGTRFRVVDHFHRRHDFEGVALRLWLLLFITATAATCIAFGVDVISKEMYDARVQLCTWADGQGLPQSKWALWLGTSAAAALAATALLKMVPAAAGSGLPEVKMLLGGIVLFESFSLKAMLIKPLSLALALASSLSIGKEGPFIHCACCIAFQLVNAKWMRFHPNVIEQREIEGLVAACACGVVCTFGAPVGGVLFAAEITSHGLFNIEHLPRAFFCVTFALTFARFVLRPLLFTTGRADPLTLFNTDFAVHEFAVCVLTSTHPLHLLAPPRERSPLTRSAGARDRPLRTPRCLLSLPRSGCAQMRQHRLVAHPTTPQAICHRRIPCAGSCGDDMLGRESRLELGGVRRQVH